MGTAAEAENKIGRSGLGLQDENSNRLVGLLSVARLFHGNSFFMKKEKPRVDLGVTQQHGPCGCRQHTHLRNWCLLDVSLVPTFYCGSDHRLLRAKCCTNPHPYSG
ncbi:hypothetical protein OESDEN_08149 [Oesophagostomum dentatum]|uniref:Uncharacterized protein n=1 Tax=Oesophagostomum dentatum TaxID=61180 RepID=A0A0B1T843_OESDE|nr:hypothetical protein OESDEN_08149 [Oesophagostomum dentatum]